MQRGPTGVDPQLLSGGQVAPGPRLAACTVTVTTGRSGLSVTGPVARKLMTGAAVASMTVPSGST